MALMRDKQTGEDVYVHEIVNDKETAQWAIARGALPLPTEMFADPPHVGKPGNFAVIENVNGEKVLSVLTPLQTSKRFTEIVADQGGLVEQRIEAIESE